MHLLRRYASVETRAPQGAGGLGPGQRRRIADHIESRLGEPLTLAGMAAELGLGACLFARLFRRSFGMPPYAYVLGLKVRGRFCRSSSNRAL